jgi:hypothetical protein
MAHVPDAIAARPTAPVPPPSPALNRNGTNLQGPSDLAKAPVPYDPARELEQPALPLWPIAICLTIFVVGLVVFIVFR